MDGSVKINTKRADLEAIVGAEKRLRLISQDVVDRFEKWLGDLDGER
jgi:type I restriction enzyme R subunit